MTPPGGVKLITLITMKKGVFFSKCCNERKITYKTVVKALKNLSHQRYRKTHHKVSLSDNDGDVVSTVFKID